MNEMHNYSIDKERAIKQMLDMSKRATKDHKSQSQPRSNIANAPVSYINLPLDTDTITILVIMYILYKEKCDMLLILALAYILI